MTINTPYVVADADTVLIVDTNDPVAAERALRAAEEEWYGKDHNEEPLDFAEFGLVDIHCGERNGEDELYWGDSPADYFGGSTFETVDGFIGAW